MKIVLGSDHAGQALRQAIAEHIQQAGHEAIEVGYFGTEETKSYVVYGSKSLTHCNRVKQI